MLHRQLVHGWALAMSLRRVRLLIQVLTLSLTNCSVNSLVARGMACLLQFSTQGWGAGAATPALHWDCGFIMCLPRAQSCFIIRRQISAADPAPGNRRQIRASSPKSGTWHRVCGADLPPDDATRWGARQAHDKATTPFSEPFLHNQPSLRGIGKVAIAWPYRG